MSSIFPNSALFFAFESLGAECQRSDVRGRFGIGDTGKHRGSSSLVSTSCAFSGYKQMQAKYAGGSSICDHRRESRNCPRVQGSNSCHPTTGSNTAVPKMYQGQ
jgi:hypothetical protein